MVLKGAELLLPGQSGEATALVLDVPLSFWGGIDPSTGRVIDVRHPQHSRSIAGRVLFMPATIGSSSASSVLLELVRGGHAPAALVLGEVDAILLLGLVVAREMGWPGPPAYRLDPGRFAEDGSWIGFDETGLEGLPRETGFPDQSSSTL